jgi:hypothetical protein
MWVPSLNAPVGAGAGAGAVGIVQTMPGPNVEILEAFQAGFEPAASAVCWLVQTYNHLHYATGLHWEKDCFPLAEPYMHRQMPPAATHHSSHRRRIRHHQATISLQG